ncbi:hypothetical protein GCM10007338_20920 [Corynebacterium pelargi]|nr:hypothetical protein GCM10007338_20920 [Corynebacterium pelargi]
MEHFLGVEMIVHVAAHQKPEAAVVVSENCFEIGAGVVWDTRCWRVVNDGLHEQLPLKYCAWLGLKR